MPTKIAHRFATFALIGGAATGAQYGIAALLHLLSGLSIVVASSIGFVVSAMGNYVLNAKLTFGAPAANRKQILRFAVSTLSGCAVNGFVLDLLLAFGWPAIGSQLTATAVVLAWNFTLGLLWVYRQEDFPK